MYAYIQTKSKRTNGNFDSFCTKRVECKIKRMWFQEQGLQYTASGYGAKIPTQYMVKWNGKWRRVYCKISNNIGTCYIGNIKDGLFINDTIED